MSSLSRIFSALICTLLGAYFGFAVSQSVYLVVHPSYMAQWQSWCLAHSRMPMSLLLRSNVIETYRVMGSYEICGLICGGLIGLMFGSYIVPRLRQWLRGSSAAPYLGVSQQLPK